MKTIFGLTAILVLGTALLLGNLGYGWALILALVAFIAILKIDSRKTDS